MRNIKLKIKYQKNNTPIILRVVKHISLFDRKNSILLSDQITSAWGYQVIANDTNELNEGDIVRISQQGDCFLLWKYGSVHNSLFTTGACNVRCKMCPQPPTKDDPTLHEQNLKILKLLKYDPKVICISGGEPTLFSKRIIDYFNYINKYFPSCQVDILTNAINLSDFQTAKDLALTAPLRTTFCVSLHADTADLQREINGVANGFNRTVQGIMNLAKLRQRIEIRPVITQQNYQYLSDIALFFYRNFPFADHIAFMGQEIIGYAARHFDNIWVDPLDYQQELCKSIDILDQKGMNVSIYNIPLCLLPTHYRKFARRSISDWKQGNLPICKNCSVLTECCGVFLTSGSKQSRGITPVTGV